MPSTNYIGLHYRSTVQYSTVQYSTVQYSTVLYSTVQYCTVQYSTVQYSTVLYSTVLYSTVLYSTVLQLASYTLTLCNRTVTDSRRDRLYRSTHASVALTPLLSLLPLAGRGMS